MMQILAAIIYSVSAVIVFEYRFGVNFGKIFFDYSANSLEAINGIDLIDSSKMTISTDRGAYFSVGDSRISLPSNDISQYPTYPSVFSLVFWANFQDYSYYIFSRSSSVNFIKISRYSTQNQLSLHIKTPYFDSTELFSPISSLPPSNFNLGVWTLLILTVSNSIGLSMNTNTLISYTPAYTYSESGAYTTSLGYPSLSTSLVGTVWNLLLLDVPASPSDYLSASSSACLVPGCSPCTPAIVSEGLTGCISTQSSPLVDSFGTSCTGCSGGCSQSVCLTCSTCSQNTCQVVNSQVLCMCGGDSTSLATACQCPQYCYYANSRCNLCNPDCSACSSQSVCEACIAAFAVPTASGCECQTGYYNTTSLTEANSCIACNPLCSSCDSDGNCKSCNDPNAVPSSECACKAGYFEEEGENGSCMACYAECKTCSSFSTCDVCVDSNAIPSEAGCTCKEGFGSNGLIVYDGACIQCNEDCQTCTEANVCSTCKDSHAFPVGVGCACNDGFYQDNGVCIGCPIDCMHCNSTQCSSCWDTNAMPRGEACYCPLGYFILNNTSNNYTQCGECNNDCSSCVGQNACSECRVTGALPSGTGCKCPDYYYNDGIECVFCANWNSTTQGCIFCGADQYFNGSNCVVCPGLCMSCSQSQCITCVDHAEIANNVCVCSEFYEGVTECSPVPFNLNAVADANNNILLIFSQEITNNLTKTDFSLTIENANFEYSVIKWSAEEFLISIQYKIAIQAATTAKLLILENITSILNDTLYTLSYSVPLTYTNSSQSELSITYQAQATKYMVVLSSLSIVLSLLNFNFVSLWSFLNTLQLLIYIRLCSIYMPPKITLVLQTFRNINATPNVFAFIISPEKSDVPSQRFYDFGFTSTNIFLNAGSYLTALIILITNMLLIMILHNIRHKKPISYGVIKGFIESSLSKFRYSAFLRLYIQSYLELVACSLVGAITLSLQSVMEMFSLVACILISGVTIITPILALLFIRSHKAQIAHHDSQLFTKYGSLLYEFSNDKGLFSSLFYFFFFTRRLLFIGILIILDQFPFVQIISNFILSVAVSFI